MYSVKLWLALAPATLLAAGCTLVPGLNINEKSLFGSNREYSVVQGEKAETYRVERADVAAGFRLIDINAGTLRDIHKVEAVAGLTDDLGSVTPAVVPPEYRVGAGDVVYVTVWDHPELTNPTGEFRDPVSAGRLVAADGSMFYPYVGQFNVAGQTVEEIRKLLSNSLATVIQKPQVDVRVVAFRSQRVQVTGQVVNPGLVTLDDTSKGILEALSERGGTAPDASRRRVLLTRGGITYQMNYGGLISGDAPSLNPPLKPGDIVHVPDKSSDQVFVLGEVAKQGPVYLQQTRSTLTEALAVSGGLDKVRANDSGILVFRRASSAEGIPIVYRLDMSQPLGLLLAGEFALQPRDVVYVKATGFAKYNSLISQLLPTITAIYQLERL